MFSYNQLGIFRRGDETPPPPWCVAVQNDDLFIGLDSTVINSIPLYGLWDYSFSAQIWKQSEMGATKQITGFRMWFQGYTGGYQYLNQKLYLAHVEESEFTISETVGMSGMTIKDKTLVKEFDFTPVNNTYNQFDFDTNFCYNGVDNLMLIWENYDGSWQSGYGGCARMVVEGEIPTIYHYQDYTFPDDSTVATTTDRRNDIRYLF